MMPLNAPVLVGLETLRSSQPNGDCATGANDQTTHGDLVTAALSPESDKAQDTVNSFVVAQAVREEFRDAKHINNVLHVSPHFHHDRGHSRYVQNRTQQLFGRTRTIRFRAAVVLTEACNARLTNSARACTALPTRSSPAARHYDATDANGIVSASIDVTRDGVADQQQRDDSGIEGALHSIIPSSNPPAFPPVSGTAAVLGTTSSTADFLEDVISDLKRIWLAIPGVDAARKKHGVSA